MSGPKEITRTWEETVQVCPRCENEFTDHQCYELEEDGFTAVPTPQGYGNLPAMCAELDDGTLWVYYHSREELDHEIGKIISGLEQTIRELQEEYDDRPGAPEEKIIERARSAGLDRKWAEHELQKLRDNGEIYSPDQNHIRLV